MGRYFCLLLFISILVMPGCGEDTEPEPEPSPIVLNVNVQDGWEIPSNAIIVVEFSEEMDAESVAITLNGVPVSATSEDGVIFSFSIEGEGEFELAITGKSISGQTLYPEYEPIKFRAVDVDTTPPEIVDDECDPRNGAFGIHVDKYGELFVVFSEPMSEVSLTAKSPDFPSQEQLSPDGRTLTIRFLRYGLPIETVFTIELAGTDLGGNPLAETQYVFTTESMEGLYPILKPLFSVGPEHSTELDKEIIPEAVRQTFRDEGGWKLSPNAGVSIGQRGHVWLIDEICIAIKNEDGIDVYLITWPGGMMGLMRHDGIRMLFSTGLEHADKLDNSEISAALREEFRNNGFLLSRSTIVSVGRAGYAWLIDDYIQYFATRDGDKIDVYILI
jgi:hypothetical protein